MNLYDTILRDNPFFAVAFASNATTYTSMTGTGAVMTATPAGVQAANSMNTGPSKPLLLSANAELRVPFPLRFHYDARKLSFSLSAWVGLDSSSPVTILGHKAQSDGLRFDGEFIHFGVKLTGGTYATASWPVPDFTKNYQVFGTYNGSRVALYIDGELADEETLPVGSTIATQTDKDIYSIAGTPAVFRIEAPSLYTYEVPSERIKAQYEAGRRIDSSAENTANQSGYLWKFSDEERDIRYTDTIDWTIDGIGTNVYAVEELRPRYDIDTSLSMSGEYLIAVPVSNDVSPTNAQGMKVEWNGDGNAVFEYSIDNAVSWAALSNRIVPINTINMAGTVTPLIRISFPAGRAAGLDVVRDMRVTVYNSQIVYSSTSRERTAILTGTPSTSVVDSEPIEDDKRAGLFNLSSINYTTIQESPEANTIGSIEMWVAPELVNGSYLFDSRNVTPSNASYMWINGNGQLSYAGFSAVYIDGILRASGSIVPVTGRLYHIVGTYTAAHNAKILVSPQTPGGRHNFRHLALYPTLLNATQAAALYKSYFGVPTLAIADTNAIVVGETSPAAKVYVKDWSHQGAG